MYTAAEAEAIAGSFDSRSLSKGHVYASTGRVREVTWLEPARLVAGMVQGTAHRPYSVIVTLHRTPAGRLTTVEGECTCPVGYACKHAAALVLAAQSSPTLGGHADRDRGDAGRAGRKAGRGDLDSASWADALRGLLETGDQRSAGDERGDAPGTIGLQFELAAPSPPPASRYAPPAGRIQIRPVLSGSSGGWVRSGVRWDTIEHVSGGWRGISVTDDQLAVLREVRALGSISATSSRYYYSSERSLWLDRITSRRIWDLLIEADLVGVPLVSAGRRAAPLTVHRHDAVLSLDVTEGGTGDLVLRPRLVADGVDLPFAGECALLVGSPPHGVVWWDDDQHYGKTETPHLSASALSGPLSPTQQALLDGTTLSVPAGDRERFFGEFFPRLRRQVPVGSSDGSVELPEVPEDALILTLTHADGHVLDLSWTTGPPTSRHHDPLRDPATATYEPAVAETVGEARRAALAHGSRAALIPFGDRLEPEASLQGMSAVRFLSDLLPQLEALPHLVVETVGEAPEYREWTEAPVVSLRGSGSAEGDWFDLAVEVAVGGEEVPFRDLFVALAGGETHLILPSGTFFSLEREELRELAELIAEARALQQSDEGGIRVSRFQSSLWEDFRRLGVLTIQADAWERSVRALATSTGRPEYRAPAGLRATLRPYQEVGFTWLAFLHELGLGGILADDMGLGKTLEALALICRVKEQSPAGLPFLVVAPTSVVGNWAAECRKFAPTLRVRTVQATCARRDTLLFELADVADVVVTSYALFRIEYDDYEKLDWAGVFFDEAQFAKNIHSHAYQRAKKLPVPFKVAMTGTPMENHLMELWALLSITAPGLFGNPERFGDYYRLPIEKHSNAERLDLLRRRVRPLLLRRTKDQVEADLPEKQEQVLELDLNPKHAKLYQTYLHRERQKVLGLLGDMQKNRFEILKSLTLLRQASLDMSLVDPAHARVPSTKLDALSEMLDDIVADGHRVLVFSQFTRFLGLARKRLKAAKIPHCYLDGNTRKRDAVIAEFREGDVPVFLISLKAGGFGLNLTEADYCILLDPWWNPATEAQAVDRAHRIGQTKKVMVYRLVSKDTIEEKVMALKAKKAALFASVIDGGGFESGALSASDIQSLLE